MLWPLPITSCVAESMILQKTLLTINLKKYYQSGSLWASLTTVSYGQRPQHFLRSLKDYLRPWPPQFVVTEVSTFEINHEFKGILSTMYICYDMWRHLLLCVTSHVMMGTARGLEHASHSPTKFKVLQACQNVHFAAKLKSQIDHLRSLAATACYGQRSQHFWDHRKTIRGLCPPQFVVAKGHNIWKITSLRNSDNHIYIY